MVGITILSGFFSNGMTVHSLEDGNDVFDSQKKDLRFVTFAPTSIQPMCVCVSLHGLR